MASWKYAHISFDKGLTIEEIDRDKARELVKAHGLSLVHQDLDGRVWDTPNKSFYQAMQENPETKKVLISLFNHVSYS